MKKKIFGAVIVAAMAFAAGWNFNHSKNEVNLTDLALANIEALADNEASAHCERLCSYWPSTYCVLETPTSYIYCMEKFPK